MPILVNLSEALSAENLLALAPWADGQTIADHLAGVFVGEGVRVGEMSVAIVDDAQMRALNRDYLEHDYVTDVLAFNLTEADGNAGDRSDAAPSAAAPIDAEVVVNAQQAVREATARRVPAVVEFALYLTHGALHLCGHDDHDQGARAAMQARQFELLERAFPDQPAETWRRLRTDHAAGE